MRLVALTITACAATTPLPLSNTVAAPSAASATSASQTLKPLVIDDLASCAIAHRVEVSVDARRVATVTITCPPPAPRLPGRRVVVVTDGVARTFDGPALAIAAGRHTIAVRDELTGRSAELTARFPIARSRVADTIVIVDDDRSIAVSVDARALLILL
jgi:hypothetical protein